MLAGYSFLYGDLYSLASLSPHEGLINTGKEAITGEQTPQAETGGRDKWQ
jgi:hypothetical protein